MPEQPVRLLFIGQAPSRETDGLPPFVGKCGRFLAELLGTTQEAMLRDYDFLNVLERWPGPGVHGDLFPMPEAKERAKLLLDGPCRGRAVVLLGNNVARAFGLKRFQYMELYQVREDADPTQVKVPLVTVIPHVSGVVRHWNRPEARLAAAKFLRGLTSVKLENAGGQVAQ